MRKLLEAGVHFGHQTKRWNPKMKPYIYGARNGIHIVDLGKTVAAFDKAYDFVANVVASGAPVLFIGTKRQAQETIRDEATRCGQYYINQRWLGGLMTNFPTIKRRIARMLELRKYDEEDMKKEKLVHKWDRRKKKYVLEHGGVETRGIAVNVPYYAVNFENMLPANYVKEERETGGLTVAQIDDRLAELYNRLGIKK